MSSAVARNAVWTVSGTLASVGVGLVALPVLLHTLGADRLGVFTLALGLIGFSGLLDLGLGRALTQGVSSALGAGKSPSSVGALVKHVMRLLAVFGLAWLVLLWYLIPLAVLHLFRLDGSLAQETIFGLRAVALSLPFALLATAAMGALEGLQEFRLVSTQRALLSVVQFGLPTLVALWRPDVGLVMGALAVSRVVNCLVWLTSLRRLLPVAAKTRHDPGDLRQLLRFGGWLSVSNVVGPLMAYADRFYLVTLFPPATVATYTVPYDALSRVTSLPLTAIGAVFPALAEAQGRPESVSAMVRVTIRSMVALLLPPMLIGAVFAKPLLSLWLGQPFAEKVAPIFLILLAGVFVNSTAHVPYALLQAHGRTDLTAKLHVAELPIFVGMLVYAVSAWGVAGAAVAWSLRVLIDAAFLYGLALLLHPAMRKVLAKGASQIGVAAIALVLPIMTTNRFVLLPVLLIAVVACCLQIVRLYGQWKQQKLDGGRP